MTTVAALAVLLAVAALNARYLAYGASVAPALSRAPIRRALEAHVLTDAAWLLGTRSGRPERGILLGAGLAEFGAWTSGTAVGAAAGASVGDGYRALGLDAAVPAFFLCLLIERLRR